MKKFNNTLEGTDCGDAGLPSRGCGTAKAKTVLRVIPKTPEMSGPRMTTPRDHRLGRRVPGAGAKQPRDFDFG